MRKLDTASNAEGSVRRESCNQEEVTTFYAIALQEEQIDAVGKLPLVQRLKYQQFNVRLRNHCE
jgi:hypothetical protein